jgi:hypothetical protein
VEANLIIIARPMSNTQLQDFMMLPNTLLRNFCKQLVLRVLKKIIFNDWG